MSQRFDYFVILAEMRTGSNFLEDNVNAIDGLTCYGEAFNPQFIGHKDMDELLGVTLEGREADPLHLLGAMLDQTDGMPGFRFFNDHDPRILDHVMNDPRCAKVILTRNPVDSYVSLKIAHQTGQWRLTDMKHQKKTARVRFNSTDFEAHVDRLHRFQVTLLNGLQTTGQTAFYLAYEDAGDIDVLNGLAAWLGVEGRLEHISGKLKKQNPAPLSEKVANYDAMQEALARIDRFDLTRTPNFEPRRGPGVPGFYTAAYSPLLFMPIQGGPVAQVHAWLRVLDKGREPLTGFSQKTLRQWKRRNKSHRAFTVVCHPVERAYRAYGRLLDMGGDAGTALHNTLRRSYKVDLPKEGATAQDHKAAFLAFLRFLKGNLAGQTGVKIHPDWATQHNVMQGHGVFHLPDLVVRAERLEADLAYLCDVVGCEMPTMPMMTDPVPVPLAEIYDADIEAAARDAYQRDYMVFGYEAWA